MKQNVSTSAGMPGIKAPRGKAGTLLRDIIRDKWLYLMLLPGVIYFIIFKYVPMYGVSMAFMDYKPYTGFLGSPWVGLKHFERFFSEPQFGMLFRNTVILAVYNLVFFFPMPIILSYA